MNIYNNGYVVKGKFRTIYSQDFDNYRGIGCYTSWPLNEYEDKDNLAKILSKESEERWFSFVDTTFLTVPEKDFIRRYVEHCNTLNVETVIYQIETPKNIQLATDLLEIVEILGWDCLATAQYSYLADEAYNSFNLKPLKKFKQRINKNSLFDSIDDVWEFIEVRNNLLKQGVNLEDYYEAIPARISIVRL